ncbi:MAG: heat-inducible transcription repressor HrcA [Anaerolineaceae bacterium]|nr:heat-inducible transcription repressor HrcA [Anaerolineaceae bacterium]
MSELTDRQKFILTLVVHEHIRSAAPVGSDLLVKNYQLDISSATVRNEMSALTELGYLRQPHTSAGRVPTEEGYRYFVSHLMRDTELPETTRRMISHQFHQTRNDADEWMRLAASVLARQSSVASLVTAPHPDKARLKHLELISTRGRQALMITVTIGGEIHQRIVTVNDPVTQEMLTITSQRLTGLFSGKGADEIQAWQAQLQGLDAEIAAWLVDEMIEADALGSGDIYLDGLKNVLAEPEFSGSEEARRALRLLEERPLLYDLLSNTKVSNGIGGVQVLIGGEGAWDEFRQWSMVLAPYGQPGLATGTLGVMGPIRMPYGRAISAVRFLAGILSEMVTESLEE